MILLVPAVSNGMTAPLNDVALAAFGIGGDLRLDSIARAAELPRGDHRGSLCRPRRGGEVSGARLVRAAGVRDRAARSRPPAVASPPPAVLVGSSWLLSTPQPRSRWAGGGICEHTFTPAIPVFPFFRNCLWRGRPGRGAGPGQTAACRLGPLDLLFSIVPLSIEPDRFDSFSHQFGPIFLLFLPALLFERAPRRVWLLALLGYLFLTLCMTQRQSMRFLLIALGPLSVAVAYLASVWSQRKTLAARCLLGVLVLALGFRGQSGGRAGSAWPLGPVSARIGLRVPDATGADLYGRSMGRPTPAGGRPADRPGSSRVLHPARLHDGTRPSPPYRPGHCWRVGTMALSQA